MADCGDYVSFKNEKGRGIGLIVGTHIQHGGPEHGNWMEIYLMYHRYRNPYPLPNDPEDPDAVAALVREEDVTVIFERGT